MSTDIEQRIEARAKEAEMREAVSAALFKLHEEAMEAATNPSSENMARVRQAFHRFNNLPIL